MEIIPEAMGQSDNVLVFWDPHPEIGVVCPRPVQSVSEVTFGLGSANTEPCLTMFLFVGETDLEIYLPENLQTDEASSVPVWEVLLEWKPEVLKVRYGETPADRSSEITFLLPTLPGETVHEKLRDMVKKSESWDNSVDGGELWKSVMSKITALVQD